MSPQSIPASHLGAQLAAEARRSEEAAILARERARERQSEPAVTPAPVPAKGKPPKAVLSMTRPQAGYFPWAV